ncbi:MAG: hypothetical protein ABUJ92_09160 [Desulfobacterales bacterium]
MLTKEDFDKLPASDTCSSHNTFRGARLFSQEPIKMPQIQLPIFPAGINKINGNVGFARNDDTIVYFYGHLPIFRHQIDDSASFRLITSQLHVDGSVKQVDIYKAFGVTPLSIKRSVKVYREKGAAGFFEKPRRRGPAVLTKPVLETIQGLLDEDYKIPEIARKLDLLADTIRKAVKVGKLHKPQKKTTHHRS